MGGEPGNEAHGGYTYCALAGLRVLRDAAEEALRSGCSGADTRVWTEARDGMDTLDGRLLHAWLSHRQMVLEGGFSGRANKLVDACYSFWQAACFTLLPGQTVARPAYSPVPAGLVLPPASSAAPRSGNPFPGFDRVALQAYLLRCCQDSAGGLKDKPGKGRDYYHTCYPLQGMSIAQHDYSGAATPVSPGADAAGPPFVLGGERNLLQPVHPMYGLVWDKATAALAHFAALPLPE